MPRLFGTIVPMAKTSAPPAAENIVEINVSDEMRSSFLEYAYSVIYARALPDARDGCKPVQRRILYQMSRMGLRPDRGHVKSQSVVGEVMGKLHPHGDAPIYDALVRLAQPFNLRLPLVDGHGNFGSLDDGPAAPRYTEARLAPAALDLVADLDEDVVDFVPNYDGRTTQPEVLPAGYPQLLVNGASGIAVGMATNIAPHNLGEVVQATCYLLDNPEASTVELMRFIPGPDLPEGGVIIGLEGIREAYETGRGTFRMRARTSVERVSARKQGIVITELPYMVGPERVIERIKEAVNSKRLQGISNVVNLTDRHHGVRLVVEVKNGFNPEAVIAQLFRYTPLEDTFSINAVALVDGRPETLSLRRMLEVYLGHRISVVRRRCQFRLARAEEALHLVEGLLIAVLDIDDVIAVIRSSEDVDTARSRLMLAFDLSTEQADHILSLRLRRLTKFSRLELERERDELSERIRQLNELLSSDRKLRGQVRKELEEVGARLSTPRRTLLLNVDPQQVKAAAVATSVPLEIPDEPVTVVLTSSGALLRVDGDEPLVPTPQRGAWDTFVGQLPATARGQVGVVDDCGLAHRVDVVALPSVPRSAQNVSLSAAIDVGHLLGTQIKPVGLIPLEGNGVSGVVSATGVIKRLRTDFPKANSFEIISLAEGDRVVFAGPCPDDADIVLISDAAQLLRTPAAKVRPQGRTAQGVAGMSLPATNQVIAAGFSTSARAHVVTVATGAGSQDDLFGADQTSVKVTPLEAFPRKGRAGMGVRCQRFLKGESKLSLAALTLAEPIACSDTGAAAPLPPADPRRDGSGQPVTRRIAALS